MLSWFGRIQCQFTDHLSTAQGFKNLCPITFSRRQQVQHSEHTHCTFICFVFFCFFTQLLKLSEEFHLTLPWVPETFHAWCPVSVKSLFQKKQSYDVTFLLFYASSFVTMSPLMFLHKLCELSSSVFSCIVQFLVGSASSQKSVLATHKKKPLVPRVT